MVIPFLHFPKCASHVPATKCKIQIMYNRRTMHSIHIHSVMQVNTSKPLHNTHITCNTVHDVLVLLQLFFFVFYIISTLCYPRKGTCCYYITCNNIVQSHVNCLLLYCTYHTGSLYAM